MPRPKNHDLVKKTLNFYEGDFEALAEMYPNTSPSVIIRNLVHSLVTKVNTQVARQQKEIKVDTSDLDV